jgi:N-formylglutamate amidohydrolase
MKDIKTAQIGRQTEEPEKAPSQIAVLHIPHASRHVPMEQRKTVRLNDAALNIELLRTTDAYTDELFPLTPVEAGRVIFPVSRLVCDVERDCHSFPSVALPYELDQTKYRADFCIGTDSFHTPSAIRDAIVTAVKEEGYSVTVAAPFSGALVPLASYRKDRRILSVMIEVNRRLYMDAHSGLKKQDFAQVSAAVGRLIVTAAEAAAHQSSS